MKIETTRRARPELRNLLAALPVDVEEHVLAAGDRRLHRRARRAVEVAEDLGVLEHLAGLDHRLELAAALEEVVAPSRSPGRGGRVVAETEKRTSGRARAAGATASTCRRPTARTG